ncbi:MAG: zf-TFIIB domain-containing protein [Verrucomicrobiota bacterium]
MRDTIPLDYPIETILDKGGGLLCPRCTATMEHYAYMGDKHIMIDSCSACKHIWVDAEELAGMSLVHARSERLSDRRRTQAQRTATRRHGLVDSHMIARAVEAGLLTHSVSTAFLICFVLSEMDGDS